MISAQHNEKKGGEPIVNDKNCYTFCGAQKVKGYSGTNTNKNNIKTTFEPNFDDGYMEVSDDIKKVLDSLFDVSGKKYFLSNKKNEDEKEYEYTNSYYGCVERIYRIYSKIHKDNQTLQTLTEALVKYVKEEDDDGLKRNFLNLQGGNLYTIFSSLNTDDIGDSFVNSTRDDEVNNSLSNYIKYLRRGTQDEANVSYEYTMELIEKVLKIKIFIIDSPIIGDVKIICPSIDNVEITGGDDVEAYFLVLLPGNQNETYNRFFIIYQTEVTSNTVNTLKILTKKMSDIRAKPNYGKFLSYCNLSDENEDNTGNVLEQMKLKDIKKIVAAKQNGMKIVKYYMSPLSHKVIGVDVKSKKENTDEDEIFIPCFPSPFPLPLPASSSESDIEHTYDSPPTNVYKNVKDVLDKLNLEVDCAVVGTENDYNNKAAIILKYSKLFIPVTQFGEKEKENLLQKCSIKYAINPYLFDYELSTMPTTEDDTRINANDMLVKESEMYSRYRVETKKVLNNMNSEIRKYLEQNGNQTEETFNTIPNKFLKARQSIVESVLSYENNEKNKNNEKNN